MNGNGYYATENQVQDAMKLVAAWLSKNRAIKVIYHDKANVDADIFSGVIRIPKLACASGITHEALNLLRHAVYHEGGHIAETHLDKSEYPKGALFEILNALEDRRMERKVATDHEGCGPVFHWATEFYNKKIAGQIAEGQGQPLWEALCAMAIQLEGIHPLWKLTPKAAAYFNAAYDEFSQIRSANSARDSLTIAKKIYEILKEENKKFNEENKPQPKPQPKQDKEQKPEEKENEENQSDGSGENEEQKPDEKKPDEGQSSSNNDLDDETDEKESKEEKKSGSSKKDSESEEEDEEENSKDKEGESKEDNGDDSEDDAAGKSDLDDGDEAEEKSDDEEDDGSEEENSSDADSRESDDGDIGGDKESESKAEQKDDKDEPSEPTDDGEEKLAKEQADTKLENETEGLKKEDALSEELKKEFDKLSPEDVSYLANRDGDMHNVPDVNDYDRENFEKERVQISVNVASLTRAFEQALRAITRCRKEPYQRHGKIDKKRFVAIAKSLSKEVFARQKNGEEISTAVEIVIDESGSMRSSISDVRLLAIAIGESLSKVGVPFEITGTTTQFGQDDRRIPLMDGMNRTNPIVYNHYKAFDEHWDIVKSRLNQMRGSKHNVDGEVVEYAAMRLSSRKESRKVIFSLSDGKPCAGQYNDDLMATNLIRVCERCRKNGIEVVGFGIGTNEPAQFYGEKHFVYLNDVAEMGGEFVKKIVSVITAGRVRV